MGLHNEDKLCLYILVVLFSNKPSKSNTLESLRAINLNDINIKPKLILWDNSLDGLYEKEYLDCYPYEIEYIHYPDNKPLSSLYNSVAMSFIGAPEYDWMIFFDDDTNITLEYFEELASESCQSSANLILPLVSNFDGRIISPGKLSLVAGKTLGISEIYNGLRMSDRYLALMSAIVVNKKVFQEGVLFDEDIPFYGVDTKFLLDYQERFSSLYFMKSKITHESRLDDLRFENFNDNYNRLSLLISSWSRSLRLTRPMRLLLFVYVPFFIIKKVILLRDLRYLKLITFIFSVFKK